MLSSTKDILFLALTVAVVVLTFFLAWLLYYLVSIIRQAHSVMKETTEAITKIHGILDSIRDSISQSSSHLALVVTAVKQLAGLYSRRRQKREEDEEEKKTKRDKKE